MATRGAERGGATPQWTGKFATTVLPARPDAHDLHLVAAGAVVTPEAGLEAVAGACGCGSVRTSRPPGGATSTLGSRRPASSRPATIAELPTSSRRGMGNISTSTRCSATTTEVRPRNRPLHADAHPPERPAGQHPGQAAAHLVLDDVVVEDHLQHRQLGDGLAQAEVAQQELLQLDPRHLVGAQCPGQRGGERLQPGVGLRRGLPRARAARVTASNSDRCRRSVIDLHAGPGGHGGEVVARPVSVRHHRVSLA